MREWGASGSGCEGGRKGAVNSGVRVHSEEVGAWAGCEGRAGSLECPRIQHLSLTHLFKRVFDLDGQKISLCI